MWIKGAEAVFSKPQERNARRTGELFPSKNQWEYVKKFLLSIPMKRGEKRGEELHKGRE